MKIVPRSQLMVFLCSLLLAGIVLGALVSSPVRADVGVHPVLPGGSSLKPDDETPVEMAAETVVMNVRSATEADNAAIKLNPEAYGLQFQPVWFPFVAEVQADFSMLNPTKEAVSMTVWFPLASALKNVGWELNPDEIVPRIASFQVEADGKAVDYAVSELLNLQGEDKPPLPWASFPVTFPAGAETKLRVGYLLPLEPSIKGSELALYYIFQTGAGPVGPEPALPGLGRDTGGHAGWKPESALSDGGPGGESASWWHPAREPGQLDVDRLRARPRARFLDLVDRSKQMAGAADCPRCGPGLA
jgi:hypothetical protein